jgi:pSer/pThr/pTyr-binding forkhead associated (FHA) protein
MRAFLVIEGRRVALLDKPVNNIGRKKDNHIVLDNQHVSRHHAQIRMIKDRYVIFDLNSTVGTSVNGDRIEHSFLRPGDVISLGGVAAIFGVGTPKINSDGDLASSESADTGPTDATDLEEINGYLRLFDNQSK